MQTIPGPIALIRNSLVFYKNNAKMFFQISLLPFCILILSSLVSNLETFFRDNTFLTVLIVILSIVIMVAGWLVQFIYPFVLIRKMDLIDRREQGDPEQLYRSGLKMFWSILLISILTSLITMAGAVVFLIPGIILALYSGYSLFFLALEDKRGIKALSSSFHYVNGNLWKVFWRGFVFSIFIILVVFVCFVVLYGGAFLISGASISSLIMISKGAVSFGSSTQVAFFLVSIIFSALYYALAYPIVMIFSYQIYKSLKSSKTAPAEDQLKKTRKWVMGLIAFGILAVFVITIFIFIAGVINGYSKAKFQAEQSAGQEQNESTVNHYAFPKIATPFPGKATGILQRDPIVDPLGFSIRIPQGWNLTDSSQDSSWVRPADESLKVALFIQKMSINENNTNINNEQIVDEIVSLALKTEDAPRDVSYSLFELEGKNIYSFSGSTIYKNDKYYSDYFIFIDGSDNYFLQVISIEDKHEFAKELLLSSVSTFKINKK